MRCGYIQNLITGTRIALPRLANGSSDHSTAWDIVRPNSAAEAMIARHLRALETNKARRQLTFIKVQSPASRSSSAARRT